MTSIHVAFTEVTDEWWLFSTAGDCARHVARRAVLERYPCRCETPRSVFVEISSYMPRVSPICERCRPIAEWRHALKLMRRYARLLERSYLAEEPAK